MVLSSGCKNCRTGLSWLEFVLEVNRIQTAEPEDHVSVLQHLPHRVVRHLAVIVQNAPRAPLIAGGREDFGSVLSEWRGWMSRVGSRSLRSLSRHQLLAVRSDSAHETHKYHGSHLASVTEPDVPGQLAHVLTHPTPC